MDHIKATDGSNAHNKSRMRLKYSLNLAMWRSSVTLIRAVLVAKRR